MEEAFRALLRGSTSVTAIVGPHVYYGEHPQGAPFPGIVLNVIDNAEGYTQQGRDRLSVGRVQVDCYAMSYPEAKQLSRAVWDTLDGHRGGGFQGIFLSGQRDGREGPSLSAPATSRPYRVSMDFLTHWSNDNA